MLNSYKNLVATNVNLDIDYNRMLNELLTMIQSNSSKIQELPGVVGGTGYGILLRNSSQNNSQNFWEAKLSDVDSWKWDDDLHIPYTRSVINGLPVNPLGMVIVKCIPKDAGFSKHTDWNDPTDYKNSLGLTIRPSTAGKVWNIWTDDTKPPLPLSGQSFLLNDAFGHSLIEELPLVSVIHDQILVKVFGIFDYDWFNSKIDSTNCYYS